MALQFGRTLRGRCSGKGGVPANTMYWQWRCAGNGDVLAVTAGCCVLGGVPALVCCASRSARVGSSARGGVRGCEFHRRNGFHKRDGFHEEGSTGRRSCPCGAGTVRRACSGALGACSGPACIWWPRLHSGPACKGIGGDGGEPGASGKLRVSLLPTAGTVVISESVMLYLRTCLSPFQHQPAVRHGRRRTPAGL